MAHSNILTPSILSEPSPGTSKQPSKQTIDLDSLKNVLTEILSETNNKTQKNDSDEDNGIDGDRNLTGMERIPDVVKSLREFSGKPGEFGSWRKSVERILNIYNHLRGTTKYYGILTVIRNKIIGCADIALESYNTPLEWKSIVRCLNLHYADKRDLGTLEYQMTALIQKHGTVPEFYQEVYQHLSLILNKLSSMDISTESMNVMVQTYRDKALDTFIRGLKGDLPRLLAMKEPEDLPQALHLCLKIQNMDYRINHSSNFNKQAAPSAPNVPLRNNLRPMQPFRNQFYPQLLHNPQPILRPKISTPVQYPNFYSKNPYTYQKPLSKPEPMDIDQSLQSRVVNYQNRPKQIDQPNKRNTSHQIHQPNKLQRVFYTAQYPHEQENSKEADVYELNNYEQALNDYSEQFEDPLTTPDEISHNDPSELESDDIHFLD